VLLFLTSAGSQEKSKPWTKQVNKVQQRRYYVILDLNGILVHRSFNELHNRQLTIRPDAIRFVDWLHRNADLSFWSTMNSKNVTSVLTQFLVSASFKAKGVRVLTQDDCTLSTYRDPRRPEKPYFLKDLKHFIRLTRVGALENVLLVDDDPLRNLTNDPFNAIFPRSWFGDMRDQYIAGSLWPWLSGLFKSQHAVPEYVRAHPLNHGQRPAEASSRPGCDILNGAVRR
jgi:hypothetical protein